MKNKMANPSPEPSEREIRNTALSRRIAADGIVLLENRGCLPFENVHRIAMFGSGARRTVKGGTGSGDVNTRGYSSVEQGLINAGFEVMASPWLSELDSITEKSKKEYYSQIRKVSEINPLNGLLTMMGNPFTAPPMRTLRKEDLAVADAAVYVLSRLSGEGADRKAVKGDYYLSDSEIADITLLSENYEKFVLLLNVGAPVELTPVVRLPNAIVLMGQGGIACGDAVADVLTGKINPSGKLTATWAKCFTDYPFAEEFAADADDAFYNEGCFVGYRSFDTFGIEPLYPFGYGKSYTEFETEGVSAELCSKYIEICVSVKNTGYASGREVIQIYAAPTVCSGNPLKTLIGFAKTQLIAPCESCSLKITVPVDRFAFYNEKESLWCIEKGDYALLCGNSSRNSNAFAVVSVSEDIVTQKCRSLFRGEKISAKPINCIPDISTEGLPVIKLCGCDFEPENHSYSLKQRIHPKAQMLSDKALISLCVGAARGWGSTDATVVGMASKKLPGAAGETTDILEGIPSITMVDGPAGLRVNPKIYERDGLYINDPKDDPIFSLILTDEQLACDLEGAEAKYQYCTALPVATQLAQTWDMAIIEEAGRMIGGEMEQLGVELWLAPALNIQRNPLCGRNFEYYSEDPLLSGLCAAAMTRGAQSVSGKGVCIKHLAANSQETNRNYNNSHVSEKTLREIYLRGFEICVREAQPASVMTSLNLINGVHAANDPDLLTKLLRCEWGFDGAVMTDWGATSGNAKKYAESSSVQCIRAGNDLIMPGSQGDEDRLAEAVKTGSLTREELLISASRIIYMIEKLSKERIK